MPVPSVRPEGRIRKGASGVAVAVVLKTENTLAASAVVTVWFRWLLVIGTCRGSLEPGSRLGQIGAFHFRRSAAEGGIAVGEAAEARNHVTVGDRVAGVGLVAEL